MKVALIGSGKTGKEVVRLHSDTVIFNTSNIPTLEKLKKCDVIISFLPGDIFLKYLDLLIETNLPVVTGATGFTWPEDINEHVNSPWIKAHNFSLGMNIVQNMIESLGKIKNLYPDATFNIHDIHHKDKVDSPSGTALSWEKWLGQKSHITAERTGDVIGHHHIEMNTEVESIKLIHEAKDRGIFAKGALWSANLLYTSASIPTKLHDFNTIVKKHLEM